MQQTVTIYQGIPGSGKTTASKEFALANSLTHVRICRDDIRNMFGKYWVPTRETLVSAIERELALQALRAGYSILLDATNLNPKTLKNWERLISDIIHIDKRPIEIIYKRFDTPLDECLRRDALRGSDRRGEKVIYEFYNRYCTNKSEPTSIEPITQNSALPRAIIVDIDGTVALTNGRGHYEYHKVDTDLPNIAVIKQVEDHVHERNVHVIFLSGREDVCKLKTTEWIRRYINVSEFQLFMRPAGDRRKDCIVKKEIFDREIKNKYYIEMCYDDRNQVVDLWRSMGLLVNQVCSREQGNF